MSRIRTFVAIDLPKSVKQKVSRVVSRLEPHTRRVRWVDLESLHLTLNFLGDQDESKVHRACQAIEQAAERIEPFDITLRGIGGFPHANKPRVIWIGIERGSEELIGLYQATSKFLDEFGFNVEPRFQPHVTIGRVKQRQLCEPTFLERLGEFTNEPFGEAFVGQVITYSSQLEHGRPVYVPMATTELG